MSLTLSLTQPVENPSWRWLLDIHCLKKLAKIRLSQCIYTCLVCVRNVPGTPLRLSFLPRFAAPVPCHWASPSLFYRIWLQDRDFWDAET